MTLPIDRSTLLLAAGNQVPYQVASATKNINYLTVVANTIDELNAKVDAHASSVLLPHTDESVSTAKIANEAVTTPKIAPQAVTSAKIANGAVGALQLDPTFTTDYTPIAIQAEFDRRGINPMKYGAVGGGVVDDTVALQNAFNDAVATGKTVILPAVFLITSALNLPKSILTRLPLYIEGINGGGIKRTTAGFMFTATSADTSDIFFQDCYFEGNAAAAVKVFDCSKIIRLNTDTCYFKNVTTVMYTDDTRYLQSIRMTKDVIIGCVGAALDFAGAYDTVLTNVLMEASSGYFINHRFLGSNPGIYGMRIRDCNIEGLTGTEPAMKFKTVESLLVDGCYFEHNAGGHIVFDATTSVLNHVTVSNCRHGGPAESGITQVIIWGKTCKGCFSYNNVAQNLGIHNTSQTTSGRIFSIYDRHLVSGASSDTGLWLDRVTDPTDSYTANAYGGYKTVWGSMKRLTSVLTSQGISAGTTITYTFEFGVALHKDDMVSIQIFSANQKITLNNFYRTGTQIKAIITNDTAGFITISEMDCVVLQPIQTVSG